MRTNIYPEINIIKKKSFKIIAFSQVNWLKYTEQQFYKLYLVLKYIKVIIKRIKKRKKMNKCQIQI